MGRKLGLEGAGGKVPSLDVPVSCCFEDTLQSFSSQAYLFAFTPLGHGGDESKARGFGVDLGCKNIAFAIGLGPRNE